MGYSVSPNDGPVACYNGPKTWQLGWTSDRNAEIEIGGLDMAAYSLIGQSDYAIAANSGAVVVLKIKDPVGDTDYYVTYNRASGINAGTREAGDFVLVHAGESSTSGSTGQSWLLARLQAGGTAAGQPGDEAAGFFGLPGSDTVIQVGEIDAATGTADITVGPPGAPTMAPTCAPSQAQVIVEVLTDNYPADTSWTVTQDDVVVKSSLEYDRANWYRSTVFCLPSSSCTATFTIVDTFGDGLCFGDEGYYMVSADGVLAVNSTECPGFRYTEVTDLNLCAPTPTPAPTGCLTTWVRPEDRTPPNSEPPQEACAATTMGQFSVDCLRRPNYASGYLDKVDGLSVLECADLCLSKFACKSFTLVPSNGRCQLYAKLCKDLN